MKRKFKKWKLIFLIIPAVMIFGIIQSHFDSKQSQDGVYYLVVEDWSSYTASLDKTSWVEIDGEQISFHDDNQVTSYPYDQEASEFEKDSKTYFSLYNDGFLTVGTHENKNEETVTYVSKKSPMYSGYENGTVEISK